MKIRNVSDQVIEKTEAGLPYVLAPGDEAPVDNLINAESWERSFPGQTARVYEQGEYMPEVMPEGVQAIKEGEEALSDSEMGEEAPGDAMEPTEGVGPEENPEQEEGILVSDLDAMKRDELNEIAARLDIDSPEEYKNKELLVVAIKEQIPEGSVRFIV